MTTEQELRQELRKISALFEGATNIGEQDAAAAAIDRMRKAVPRQNSIGLYFHSFPASASRATQPALNR